MARKTLHWLVCNRSLCFMKTEDQTVMIMLKLITTITTKKSFIDTNLVWNRSSSKGEALKAKFPDKFVIIKSTPKEVVEACKITYSMLSTPEVSKQVFEDEAGVLAGVSAGKCIVDCATLAEVNALTCR